VGLSRHQPPVLVSTLAICLPSAILMCCHHHQHNSLALHPVRGVGP
jgi:hypothetical protein